MIQILLFDYLDWFRRGLFFFKHLPAFGPLDFASGVGPDSTFFYIFRNMASDDAHILSSPNAGTLECDSVITGT